MDIKQFEKTDPNFAIKIDRIHLSENQISETVKRLGNEIKNDFLNEEIVLVGVLNGAMCFLTDLMRQIPPPINIEIIHAHREFITSEKVEIKVTKDATINLDGKHVILVDTIIDTGLTLKYLKSHFENKGAKSVKLCTLIDKTEARTVKIEPDYSGYSVPNKYYVGYGLDFVQGYRNLPYIISIKDI